MSQVCRLTSRAFEAADSDLLFLKKLSPRIGSETYALPLPTVCPEERLARRLNWRNAHNLYRRTCGLSGKPVISAYSPESPFTVYSHAAWWSDEWEPQSYGREFDFSRPFFAQFRELQLAVPRLALMNRDSENSDYCNYAGGNKNCYLINGGSWYNENCYYGEAVQHCRDCLNCSFLRKSELCCEAFEGSNLYRCSFVADCHDCSECFFCADLRNCQDCFFCTNLRRKTGYIFNQPASDEALNDLKQRLRSASELRQMINELAEFRETEPRPPYHLLNCENCSGDYLTNCRNVHGSFIGNDVEDGKYFLRGQEGKDLYDTTYSGVGGVELLYETVATGIGGQRNLFGHGLWSSNNTIYCDTMMSCSDCFGCVGLKREKYCILNRRCTEEDYENLVGRIIGHMCETGEWGEFFPPGLSPWAYNESDVVEHFPRPKAAALALGYSWRDEVEEHFGSVVTMPDSLDQIPDEITDQVFVCEQSGKRFKIIKPELQLHRKLGIAPLGLSPAARLSRRHALRNPLGLWNRSCEKCGAEVATTLSPERSRGAWCWECYQREVD